MIYKTGDYSQKSYRCRYLVIGTGAGGSVAGALLAEKGQDVIMLEEGGYHVCGSYVASVGESLSKLYRNNGVSLFWGVPSINFLEACCVGGGTVVNGGLIWRPLPSVFEKWQMDNGLKGYLYSDLEKHFKTVERDINVEVQNWDLNEHLNSLHVLRGAENLGWKAVKVPRAVKKCANLNRCMAGCPIGAKQSTLENYIPRALDNGARLFTNCRAIKIEHSDGVASKVMAHVVDGEKKRNIEIVFDHLILSGGSVQSPHLLRKSKISSRAGREIQFNVSMKIAARFNEPVNADKSSPFTIQIQEFLNDGLIINVSQFKTIYLALAMAQFSNKIINDAIANQSNFALYIGFMSSLSRAHLVGGFNGDPFVLNKFDPRDLPRIKLALKRIGELLFQSGAIELYLPVAMDRPVKSLVELDKILEGVKPDELDLVTVHVMSSCAMGSDPKKSVVDLNGKVWGMKNVMVCDASILPSSFGESPQGTIMAFAHEVMGRKLQLT